MNLNLLKIIKIYLLCLVIINLTFFAISKNFSFNNDDQGLIVKFPQFKRVYVFAHGNFIDSYSFKEHTTTLNGKRFPTVLLIEKLINEDYEYIWLSQCETGNSPLLYADLTDDKRDIYWSDYPQVSRNENPGSTVPLFYGFGFIRLSL